MLGAIELISELLLIVSAAILVIPAVVLLLQVTAPHRVPSQCDPGSPRPRVGVIVPAHNEESCIGEALKSVKSQLRTGDHCLVVADNCSDLTARVARENGVLVVERHDLQNRGKGFAIDFGKRHLDDKVELDVIIIIDADCRLGEGAIELLSRRCAITNRPTQAAYLMELKQGHQYNFGTVKQLASRIKNCVRPLGGLFWGLPCQLTGSGMAFPRLLFSKTNFATSSVVEDLMYGIDLAVAGYPAVFCPGALVYSAFPIRTKAMLMQRRRWEHGHLASMMHYMPLLIEESLRQKRLSLLAMAADLAVPPLALFLLLSSTSAVASVAFFCATGHLLPMITSSLLSTILLVAIIVIWFRHGRDLVSLKDLCLLPSYVISKLPLYISFVTNRQTDWVRTDRDDTHS